MSVKIGSARSDERGFYTGGKAGDQSGQEVSFQDWYAHTKGWVVLRAKEVATRESIAWDMEQACKNENIGYDQDQRNTLWNYAEKVGYNCAKVDRPCETDCSALVRVCCAFAGIIVSNFNTASERKRLMDTGKFDLLTDPKYTQSSDYLLRGDILVTEVKGHTVVVLSDGDKMAPKEPEPIKIKPSPNNKKSEYSKMYVTTGNLYLRSGYGTEGTQKIVVMKTGTKFRCYGYWAKVDGRVWLLGQTWVDGKEYTGWASTKYLK